MSMYLHHIIFLKSQKEIQGRKVWDGFFFAFKTFQDFYLYTNTSGLNLQMMSQLGLMKYSGLVTSTSD